MSSDVQPPSLPGIVCEFPSETYLYDYSDSISLIDFCCFFGSLKRFKYLFNGQEEIKKLLILSKKMDIHLKNA